MLPLIANLTFPLLVSLPLPELLRERVSQHLALNRVLVSHHTLDLPLESLLLYHLGLVRHLQPLQVFILELSQMILFGTHDTVSFLEEVPALAGGHSERPGDLGQALRQLLLFYLKV